MRHSDNEDASAGSGRNNSNDKDDKDDDDTDDPGFFCHFVVVILSVGYVVWIARGWFHERILPLLPPSQQQQLSDTAASLSGPAATWTYVIPLTLVFLFYAMPMIYGSINALSTHAPESIHVIWDHHHHKQRIPAATTATTSTSTSRSFHEQQAMPEICDLDVSWINDLIWKTDPLIATHANTNR